GVGGRAAGCGDVVELDLELHAELGGPVGEFPDDRDRATVRLDPDHEPQREVAVDDDLLDVDQVDVVGREDGHHARRDAGPVGPGDGEERRGAGGAHGFSWWFAWHALNPAGTGVPAGFIRPRRPRVSSGAV